ncbi:MAG: SLAC1 anion channel family protein [Rhizobacter sp.]|nr:SLAC1 anion channel family protein [Rhizobacter sp.]
MAHHPTPLKFLFPGWYAVVMGLAGLSLAWHRAMPLMGETAGVAALVLGGLAAVVFAALAVATMMRARRYPEAWQDDRRHAVRHAFIATLPLAVSLLATVAAALFGDGLWVRLLWWCGSLSQLFVTVWVMARWWRGNAGANERGGLAWAAVTPALFLPVVGNMLAPLAGTVLGASDWAAAQFGIGLMLWPVVLVLIASRVVTQGMLPERLLPALFIFIAPPAVAGLGLLSLGAPLAVGWACWGMALFTLLWVGTQVQRIIAAPFAVMHWAVSFPLAAFTTLTLRLATPGSGMAVLGPVLLAFTSLIVWGLLMATWRGLREGSLLAPETVATINVAGASAEPAGRAG